MTHDRIMQGEPSKNGSPLLASSGHPIRLLSADDPTGRSLGLATLIPGTSGMIMSMGLRSVRSIVKSR